MDVEGVDGCIVGPVDLCISPGIPFRFDHPKYLGALRRVREAGQRTGKPVGHPLLGSMDDARRTYVDRWKEACVCCSWEATSQC